MNRTKGTLAGLSLLLAGSLGCATAPPVSGPGLSLKKVVIYRNGVGYFERGGHVDSDRVQFDVRKDEVGDFLATLAVLERGGSSVRSASFPLEVASDVRPRRRSRATRTPTSASCGTSSWPWTARSTTCRSATSPRPPSGARRTGW